MLFLSFFFGWWWPRRWFLFLFLFWWRRVESDWYSVRGLEGKMLDWGKR